MQKNTIGLILFNIFNTGAQFLLVIILSRYFNKEDYATFRQLFLPSEIIAPLLGLGLSSSIFYFYPRYSNKLKLLISSLTLVLISCLIFELLLVCGLDEIISISFKNESLLKYFYYLGFFSFFSLSNTILYSYFILENKVRVNIIVNFIFNFLLLVFLFILVTNTKNIEGAILLRTLIYGVSFITMLIMSKPFKRFQYSLDEFLSDLRTIFIYSFPISLSLLLGVISYQIDKIIVSSFCSTGEYAMYVNGAFEIPVIAIVTSSIAGASFGLFTQFCKEKQFDKANDLFNRISLASAIIIFPCFIFLFFYSKETIILIFGKKYIESYFVFEVYLLLLPIRIIQYGNVLIALGKTNVLLFRSIIELVISAASSIFLFKLFGYKGIVFGTVIAVLFWTVPYNLIIISRGFNLPVKSILPVKKLVIITICCLVSILPVSLLEFYTTSISLLFKMSIVFVVFCLIYLVLIQLLGIIKYDSQTKFKLKLL